MKVNDLDFKKFINEAKIEKRVSELGKAINNDYKDKAPIFLPILNGSFIEADQNFLSHIIC